MRYSTNERRARTKARQPRTVRAAVNYFGGANGKPEFFSQDHRLDNWVADPHEVEITDARTLAEQPSFEREGFVLVKHVSKVKDWLDNDELDAVYLPEMGELLTRLLRPARLVVGRGALLRFSKRSPLFNSRINSQPAHFPHVDWTPKSAPGLGQKNYFTPEPETLSPGQYLIGFNTWRVVSGPPIDQPLTLCDASSVAREDLVAANATYDVGEKPWHSSEGYMLRHNPNHRWIYFRDMQPDEVLIFRGYDNYPVWRSGAPHTAFPEPNCPPNSHGRMSVEARAYAIFDE